MKIWLYLAFLICVTQTTFAGIHLVQDCGVEISLPDTWTQADSGGWGYLVNPPEKSLGIRIHLKSPEDKTVWDILNGMIRTYDTKTENQERPGTGHRVVSVSPFTAKSGIEGLKIITGSFDKDKKIKPNVFHYLFFNAAGRSVCVCVYRSQEILTSEEADTLVLPSLKLTTKI